MAPPKEQPRKTIPLTVQLKLTKNDLKSSLRQRFERGLRQDYIAQVRVNARLLDGFEGFHGELATLWRQTRERKDKELARHRIKDERKNISIKEGALDNGMGAEEAAKLMERLRHTGIPGPDSERGLLRTMAKAEGSQEQSKVSGVAESVEARVLGEINATPSGEEAIELGEVGSVETSVGEMNAPPYTKEESQAVSAKVKSAESEVVNESPAVETDSSTARGVESFDTAAVGEGKSASSI